MIDREKVMKGFEHCINREKVIKGLACCDNMDNDGQYLDCDNCPYNDDMELGTCLSLTALHRDALALLKADQAELIQQSRRIKLLEGERMEVSQRKEHDDEKNL